RQRGAAAIVGRGGVWHTGQRRGHRPPIPFPRGGGMMSRGSTVVFAWWFLCMSADHGAQLIGPFKSLGDCERVRLYTTDVKFGNPGFRRFDVSPICWES